MEVVTPCWQAILSCRGVQPSLQPVPPTSHDEPYITSAPFNLLIPPPKTSHCTYSNFLSVHKLYIKIPTYVFFNYFKVHRDIATQSLKTRRAKNNLPSLLFFFPTNSSFFLPAKNVQQLEPSQTVACNPKGLKRVTLGQPNEL